MEMSISNIKTLKLKLSLGKVPDPVIKERYCFWLMFGMEKNICGF